MGGKRKVKQVKRKHFANTFRASVAGGKEVFPGVRFPEERILCLMKFPNVDLEEEISSPAVFVLKTAEGVIAKIRYRYYSPEGEPLRDSWTHVPCLPYETLPQLITHFTEAIRIYAQDPAFEAECWYPPEDDNLEVFVEWLRKHDLLGKTHKVVVGGQEVGQ
jgi:hypothetical protein